MKGKFVWLIVSCLMVTALVLASCKAPVVEEKKEEKKEVVKKEEEKVEEVVEEKTKYGGIIVTALDKIVTSWDPLDRVAATNYYLGHTRDSLLISDYWIDPDISTYASKYDWKNTEATWIGHLAESWDWSNPLKMTFTLRKGVRWQNKPPVNGREFVADDVVWYFERILAHPRQQGTIAQKYIDTVTAPDNYTVVFTFKEPYVALLNAIGISNPGFLAHDVVDAYGEDGFKEWQNVVGTGPWILEDFVTDSSATYTRNPDYWGKDPDGNQLPFADGTKILIITDAATRIAALRTGKMDLTIYELPIAWNQKPSLEQTNPGMGFAASPDGGLLSLWLRSTYEPHQDIRVRQALSMTINREALVDVCLGGSGTAFGWPARPGWPSFTPLEELPDEIREIYEWKPENVAKAKALLAEAGYPNGFATSLQYLVAGSKYEPWQLGLELIKSWWEEIGVDLQLRPVDRGTASALRAKPFPYDHMLGVGGGQENVMGLLEGKYLSTGPWNRAVISDPYIDDLIGKIGKEFDEEKRTEQLREIFQYIAYQSYDITMPVIHNFMAWQPWVKGYSGQTNIGEKYHGHVHARIWLDQELKKEMTGR